MVMELLATPLTGLQEASEREALDSRTYGSEPDHERVIEPSVLRVSLMTGRDGAGAAAPMTTGRLPACGRSPENSAPTKAMAMKLPPIIRTKRLIGWNNGREVRVTMRLSSIKIPGAKHNGMQLVLRSGSLMPWSGLERKPTQKKEIDFNVASCCLIFSVDKSVRKPYQNKNEGPASRFTIEEFFTP